MEGGGSGKLRDTRKVLVLQIVAGVQAAAGQDGVLDAGRQEVPIAHFQIEVVQFLQQTALRVVPQVLQVIPVDLAHGAAGLLHELPADARFLAGTVLPLQRRRHSPGFFSCHFPQVGRPCPTNRAGVGHVTNIFQVGPSGALPNKRDTLGAGLHPPPHRVVPQLHAGAGGGVRALSVEKELVIEGIFEQAGRSTQIVFPTARVPRDGVRGVVGQF